MQPLEPPTNDFDALRAPGISHGSSGQRRDASDRWPGESPRSTAGWRFDNTYARLPPTFHARLAPVPVRAPRLILLNRPLAIELGLDVETLEGETGAAIFGGNRLPDGAEPLAQAYAGHQFGHFTMLGDGRAILLGEQITPDGRRFDLQLKGSGPTPFSRRGDGRAALGPMLREYLVSEAMHALGIPTTRSLAVTATGESVWRDRDLPGAVLTRVASSHLRVGTFEYVAARGDPEELRLLADYTLRRHFPELLATDHPYLSMLEAVIERQASLIAAWMQVGFVHGVMNTDNLAISGETIDYGPCAFLDRYDPATVFSSIDRHGRYAFANQPPIAQWNLARFAETLLPLLDPDPRRATALAEAASASFPARFHRQRFTRLRGKLGLLTEDDGDGALIEELLSGMQHISADYTYTFLRLTETADAIWPGADPASRSADRDGVPPILIPACPDSRQPANRAGAAADAGDDPLRQPELRDWLTRWRSRLARQGADPAVVRQRMQAHNPRIIPRNHWVEEALTAAVEGDDLTPFNRLLAALAQPYSDTEDHASYRLPPPPPDRPYRTFCGT